MTNLEEFQQIIGYTFKDSSLLEQALTHSSYANERQMRKRSDNERLEYLGDAVLELVSSDFLYHVHRDYSEGQLTRLRASIVCEPTLASCGNDIRLGEFIKLGKGEEQTGGRSRKSVVSDALEAVIGAIYLDGGLKPAKIFIRRFILVDLESRQLFYDSKTILQEYVQGEYAKTLHYEVVRVDGPDHAKVFHVEARIDEDVVGIGSGSSKKMAEQEAAYHALLNIKKPY